MPKCNSGFREKTYGGSNADIAYSAQQTSDGGFIVAGYTYSFGAGGNDIWLIKLNQYGTMSPSCNFIKTTNITAVNSSAPSAVTAASTSSPSFTTKDTGITGWNSTASDSLICESVLPPPGGVPDNDNYPGVPLSISKSGSNLVLNWGIPAGTCITQEKFDKMITFSLMIFISGISALKLIKAFYGSIFYHEYQNVLFAPNCIFVIVTAAPAPAPKSSPPASAIAILQQKIHHAYAHRNQVVDAISLAISSHLL